MKRKTSPKKRKEQAEIQAETLRVNLDWGARKKKAKKAALEDEKIDTAEKLWPDAS